jgi:hypothetical protein
MAMDDLELRRRLYADPNDQDLAMQEALASSPNAQQLAGELQQLDNHLAETMKISTPEGLAERIILKQTMAEHSQQQRRTRVHLAMAASIAFVIGTSFTLLKSAPRDDFDIIHYSLAHAHDEQAYLEGIDESLGFEQVNHKLATFGGELNKDVGHIYFANFCDFDGTRSLHLIVDDGSGHRVTIFVVPDNSQSIGEQFSDGRLAGKVLRFTRPHGENMSVVVLAEPEAKQKQVAEKLTQALTWQST